MSDDAFSRCAAEHQDARYSLERMVIANSLFISPKTRNAIDLLIECIESRQEDAVRNCESELKACEDCIAIVYAEAPERVKD